MPEVIVHRLDLLIRCIDTTTGDIVSQGLRFLVNGKDKRPSVSPDGYFLYIGTGRDDCELTVYAEGYEPAERRVEYAALDERLPAIELMLIPNMRYRSFSPLHTLSGRMEGLCEIDAVRLDDNTCLIREFDERKRIITVFNPHRMELDRIHYAVVNVNEKTYEPFTIAERISDKAFKIDRPLAEPFSNHFPISRLIFGKVDGQGNYLLRVRDTATEEQWLVRCKTAERQAFMQLGFKDAETTALAVAETEKKLRKDGVYESIE